MSHRDPLYETWRACARGYLARGVDPTDVSWTTPREAQLGLFSTTVSESSGSGATAANADAVHLPRALVQAMPSVAAHTDPRRWDTMYRIMWRIHRGEKHLLRISVDPDVAHFTTMLQAVRRDVHKMHAFVRFRKTAKGAFVAWYRPDHRIFRLAVPHFAKRYPNMHWSIYSRDESAHWDTRRLSFGEGCERHQISQSDGMEDLWGIYYGAIFNPARLKLRAMRREMPVRYWSVMPETRLITQLVRDSASRVRAFEAAQPRSARDFLPADTQNWHALAKAARACTACDFCSNATQTVFGEGPLNARLLLVGEQPGDEEDTRGQAFVGPAGQLLNRAMGDAGIAREDVYLTNAVKHFKWTPRGKKRIHKRPLARDIAACKPWLACELDVVKPDVVVCLGATAAQAVFGRVTSVGEARGQWWSTGASRHTRVTTHPAHILRLDPGAQQDEAYAQFVADLKEATERARATPHAAPQDATDAADHVRH